MYRQPITSMLNLALSLTDALDLINHRVMNHHR